ncbi:hypothetical protein Y1Q_0016880 [Alligator mississippiensis]|uniref:Uncharacterized protein n=1 Tax=Alligator mississippiensis TaxID=8496 RepID=A0A151P6Y3_ALLMI|nr:hypothetical protein Y1Q_0016880 [Alligator mississippiensis]
MAEMEIPRSLLLLLPGAGRPGWLWQGKHVEEKLEPVARRLQRCKVNTLASSLCDWSQRLVSQGVKYCLRLHAEKDVPVAWQDELKKHKEKSSERIQRSFQQV